MATSRTGSGKYLRNRGRVLRDAQASGLNQCPGYDDDAGVHHPCGVELDYETPRLDNSAETDHILQPRFTGGIPDDSVENLRVICRSCNRARETKKQPIVAAPPEQFPTLRAW